MGNINTALHRAPTELLIPTIGTQFAETALFARALDNSELKTEEATAFDREWERAYGSVFHQITNAIRYIRLDTTGRTKTREVAYKVLTWFVHNHSYEPASVNKWADYAFAYANAMSTRNQIPIRWRQDHQTGIDEPYADRKEKTKAFCCLLLLSITNGIAISGESHHHLQFMVWELEMRGLMPISNWSKQLAQVKHDEVFHLAFPNKREEGSV